MHDFGKFTREPGAAANRKKLLYFSVASALVLAIAALYLSLLWSGGGQGGGGSKISGIMENLSSAPDEPQNILILGVDKRSEGESGVEGTRADTIMLARIYPKSGDIKLVSIPRDLLVEVSPGEEGKINAAYAYGGVSGTRSAVEHFANVRIDHYTVVDFEGFEQVVEAIGGLGIDVDENQVPPHWKVKDGVQQLGGQKALIYARYRDTPGGDLDRIRRQQEVLAALRSKAFRWRSVERLPRITRAVADNVETDMSFTRIASLGKTFGERGRNSVMTATQLKGTPDTLPNGSEVLVPDNAENEPILRDFRD